MSITGSLPGDPGVTCATANFDTHNFGMIVATGDVILPSDFIFTGFIYTQGQFTADSDVGLRGGLFSNNTASTVTILTSPTAFCGGANLQVLNSAFNNFTTITWQDRPNNKP